jgi:carbonic anhydrase/acetyltransferase-like protein (isoleucine patch superfamily)
LDPAVNDPRFLDTTVSAWRDRLARAYPEALLPEGVLASERACLDAVQRLREGRSVRSNWGLANEIAALTETPLELHPRAGAQGEPDGLDPRKQALGLTLPGSDRPLEVADAWILPVGHWVERLWANLLALGPFLWSELVGSGVTAAGRLAWAAARAGSLRPEDLAAKLNVLGRGAQIHRSAVVEGCVLREGARVGAGAVVRGAILGPGAVVEELALVEGAVLGENARVQRMAMLKFGVLDTDAAHAGIAQLGMIGRGAVVKQGAILMDMTLTGGGVRVEVDGTLRPAPLGLCGVHVEPGAVLAQGVRVGPGRVIPAGLTVFGAEDVLRDARVPEGAREARVRAGKLEVIA